MPCAPRRLLGRGAGDVEQVHEAASLVHGGACPVHVLASSWACRYPTGSTRAAQVICAPIVNELAGTVTVGLLDAAPPALALLSS